MTTSAVQPTAAELMAKLSAAVGQAKITQDFTPSTFPGSKGGQVSFGVVVRGNWRAISIDQVNLIANNLPAFIKCALLAMEMSERPGEYERLVDEKAKKAAQAALNPNKGWGKKAAAPAAAAPAPFDMASALAALGGK